MIVKLSWSGVQVEEFTVQEYASLGGEEITITVHRNLDESVLKVMKTVVKNGGIDIYVDAPMP